MSQENPKKRQEPPVNTRDVQHEFAKDSIARECSGRVLQRDRLRAIQDMLESDQYDPPALLVAEQMINKVLAGKDSRST
jgi:hypothetical protein